MKTNYQQLEQKIQELQNEHQRKVDELRAEVNKLKAQEKEDKLPKKFNRKWVLQFLNDPFNNTLSAFVWSSTPQGFDYWNSINYKLNCIKYNQTRMNISYKVPDEAIIQLQKWVIQSYQQEFGQ